MGPSGAGRALEALERRQLHRWGEVAEVKAFEHRDAGPAGFGEGQKVETLGLEQPKHQRRVPEAVEGAGATEDVEAKAGVVEELTEEPPHPLLRRFAIQIPGEKDVGVRVAAVAGDDPAIDLYGRWHRDDGTSTGLAMLEGNQEVRGRA